MCKETHITEVSKSSTQKLGSIMICHISYTAHSLRNKGPQSVHKMGINHLVILVQYYVFIPTVYCMVSCLVYCMLFKPHGLND